jgi:hypothetical protein
MAWPLPHLGNGGQTAAIERLAMSDPPCPVDCQCWRASQDERRSLLRPRASEENARKVGNTAGMWGSKVGISDLGHISSVRGILSILPNAAVQCRILSAENLVAVLRAWRQFHERLRTFVQGDSISLHLCRTPRCPPCNEIEIEIATDCSLSMSTTSPRLDTTRTSARGATSFRCHTCQRAFTKAEHLMVRCRP